MVLIIQKISLFWSTWEFVVISFINKLISVQLSLFFSLFKIYIFFGRYESLYFLLSLWILSCAKKNLNNANFSFVFVLLVFLHIIVEHLHFSLLFGTSKFFILTMCISWNSPRWTKTFFTFYYYLKTKFLFILEHSMQDDN